MEINYKSIVKVLKREIDFRTRVCKELMYEIKNNIPDVESNLKCKRISFAENFQQLNQTLDLFDEICDEYEAESDMRYTEIYSRFDTFYGLCISDLI